ncbi:hypothetical protein AW168_39905 [Nocardia brasiliensis]|nr:hypothetical protein AW168_39905 [Nocardia brasiliensis]
MRSVRRRAQNAVVVQPDRDRSVTAPGQVLSEDPSHDPGSELIDSEDTKLQSLSRPARIRVWRTIDHDIPIWCPTALVASFVRYLSIHRGPRALLNMLALGLTHPAEHAHQHVV